VNEEREENLHEDTDEDFSTAARSHRADLEVRNEVFRGLMLKAIKNRRESTSIGIRTAAVYDRAVPVRARLDTFRFGASAINDL